MASSSTVLANMKLTLDDAFRGHGTRDWELLASTRAQNFTHQILPSTLQAPEFTVETYEPLFMSIFKPGLSKRDIRPKSKIFDVEQRKAAASGRTEADEITGPAATEFMMIVCFNDDGTKAIRIDEVLDPEFYKNYLGKVGEMLEVETESRTNDEKLGGCVAGCFRSGIQVPSFLEKY